MDWEEFADFVNCQNNDYKNDTFVTLNKIRKRLEAKEEVLKDVKYERDLIELDLCRFIDKELSVSPVNLFNSFITDTLKKAWRWNAHKHILDGELNEGRIDKKEYELYNNCFNVVVEDVTRTFFGPLKDEAEFKQIIAQSGYCEAYAYDFCYEYKGIEIHISVPTFHDVYPDNYYQVLSGYCVRYVPPKYPGVLDSICNGLDYNEVAEKFQAWLKEEGWKKGELE